MRTFGKRECDRCGAEITAFCPSLKTLLSVGRDVLGPRDVLESKIATLENVAVEVVREYVDHRMISKCEELNWPNNSMSGVMESAIFVVEA